MSQAREDFVKKNGAAAVKATQGTGIFPEVLLAQAILESSRDGIPGKSELSRKYNNFHGIKAYPKYTGKTVNFNTREVLQGKTVFQKDDFAVFDSIEDGFKGYVDFLTVNPRYKKAGVFSAKTIAQQIAALKAAGYATDPEYVTLTNNIAVRVKEWIKDIRPNHVIGLFGMVFLSSLLFF